MSRARPHFSDPDWIATASHSGFSSFSDFWDLAAAQIDDVNKGRGGWSSVARCSLHRADGSDEVVYIKRQVNYTSRTLRHPFSGVPTIEREYDAIQMLNAAGITTPEVLYFAVERVAGELRAILITRALSGYESLDRLESQTIAPAVRRQHSVAAASLLRSIHDVGQRHNCYYPKHIFLRRSESGGVKPCIIDLEKMRWTASRRRAALRDIRTLFNRVPRWTRTQRLRFLLAYAGEKRVTREVKFLWSRLAAKR